MGIWDKFKESYERAGEKNKAKMYAIEHGLPVHKEPYQPFQNPYHPSMGTSDYEQFLEQNAPHLIEAIYKIRDRVDRFPENSSEPLVTNEEYKVLQARYEELKRHYENLQKQYDDVTEILKNVTKER